MQNKNKLNRRSFLKLSSATVGTMLTPTAIANAQPTNNRIWVGPNYWANPLYDWKVENGFYVGKVAERRTMHSLVQQIGDSSQPITLTTNVKFDPLPSGDRKGWAGFFFGARGDLDDYQHLLFFTKNKINAGLKANGEIFIGTQNVATNFNVNKEVGLSLQWTPSNNTLSLTASQSNQSKAVSTQLNRLWVKGNIGLAAEGPKSEEQLSSYYAKFKINQTVFHGDGLTYQPEQRFGPILWTKYTLAHNTLKLTAQMPPIGLSDSQLVQLEVQNVGHFQQIASANIDPESRTATFTIPNFSMLDDVNYRVIYNFEGEDDVWSGTIRREPHKDSISVGLMSCDNGYAFPTTPAVETIKTQNPDVLYFAGDQIYESYGGFGTIRTPLGLSLLDYLYKWYRFGWTWRELLKDRPSFLALDDHDVYQGNIWGASGIPAVDGTKSGGYTQIGRWVNAVQRMQTSHMPDPYDPEPIEQEINVYFTKFAYGGIGWSVLEDRKFKSGDRVLPGDYKTKTNPAYFDVPEASLLGSRQEKMLREWADDPEPIKIALSQTIFNQAHTHNGPKLKLNDRDLDTNGWPQTPRNRAVSLLASAGALHLVGDQHIGQLVRYGINGFDDGSLAYMGTGTANGWPRAWWPTESGQNPFPGFPDSGRFFDSWNNRMTVHRSVSPLRDRDLSGAQTPYELAELKMSGVSIIHINKPQREATFEAFRFNVDVATNGAANSQYPGFPLTLPIPEPIDWPRHQTGHIQLTQANKSSWTKVTFDQPFAESPIVVAGPPSFRGPNPVTIRIRKITKKGFEIQLDEWDYQDGEHSLEHVFFLAMVPGIYELNGVLVEAGRISQVDHGWKPHQFEANFSAPPIILPQVSSYRGPAAVTKRLAKVSNTGFLVRVQEEEKADGRHVKEQIDYVALQSGEGELNGKRFKVGFSQSLITHQWKTVPFEASLENPGFLAAAQTFSGKDPISVRYRNLTNSDVQVRCQEETSKDKETAHHFGEKVGWVVFES